MRLRTCPAILVALLLASVPVALATHSQPLPSGGSVTFQDKPGGNEWWVEAIVRSTAAISKVEVMDTGGGWATMAYKPEWGSYALGYHVEPGHLVTFRATTSAGTVTSCPFTHPAGTEQCASSPPPPPPPPPPGTFDATFTGVRGNEWWIQANVATNGPAIAKVDVTLDGGATFKPLAKQSWGATAWAASYRIVQGTVVQLRATATDGQVDLSSCRQWIPPANTDATIVQCGSSPPPPPPPSGVTFSNVKGNEYWVEAQVQAARQIYGVFLYFDCDPNFEPHDMTYHPEWNKWALGGVRIPAGTRVTMYAFGDGVEGNSQGYIWPNATPTSGCPPPPAWPRDGSYAEYALYNDVSGGGASEETRATLRLTYVVPPAPYAANWESTCTGTTTRRAADGTTTVESWTGPSAVHPPVMTRTPRVGYSTAGTYVSFPDPTLVYSSGQRCLDDESEDWTVVATGTQTKTMRLLDANGQPRTMTVWHAQNDASAESETRVIEWETNVGLTFHWERTGHMSGMAHFGGDLVRTDAPV